MFKIRCFNKEEIKEHFSKTNINKQWKKITKVSPELMGCIWEVNGTPECERKRRLTGWSEDETHVKLIEGLVSSVILIGDEATQYLLDRSKCGFMLGTTELKPQALRRLQIEQEVDLQTILIVNGVRGIVNFRPDVDKDLFVNSILHELSPRYSFYEYLKGVVKESKLVTV